MSWQSTGATPAFATPLVWNREFVAAVIWAIRSFGNNIYFMPTRVNLTDHLADTLPDE